MHQRPGRPFPCDPRPFRSLPFRFAPRQLLLMRLRASQQLFLSYLILIAAATLMARLGADAMLRDRLLQNAHENLRREALLAREIYENAPSATADSMALRIANMIGRPVTDATLSAAPPRASPSSLESTTPVKSTPSWKARAVVTAS